MKDKRSRREICREVSVCSMNEKQKERVFPSGRSNETLRTCIYSSKARFGETLGESLHSKFTFEPTVLLFVNGLSPSVAFPATVNKMPRGMVQRSRGVSGFSVSENTVA